jgi:hypothetical protein
MTLERQAQDMITFACLLKPPSSSVIKDAVVHEAPHPFLLKFRLR